MVKEHAATVFALMQKTPNDVEGIGKVFWAADAAITTVDQELVELLDQRDNLSVIIREYAQLYRIVQGEELRKSGEIIETLWMPHEDLDDMEGARKAIADISRRTDLNEVTADWILEQLNKRSLKVPWRNPKAVIATILLRSGRWQKKEQGVFIPTKEKA